LPSTNGLPLRNEGSVIQGQLMNGCILWLKPVFLDF
jgi:hypothetical protein